MSSEWTVLFRDGVPAQWQAVVQRLLEAFKGSKLTLIDLNRSVRMGSGFIDLQMNESLAATLEKEVRGLGIEARAVRWAECENVTPPQRHLKLAVESAEPVPDVRWEQLDFAHLVMAPSAAFFLPPEVSSTVRTTAKVATALDVGTTVLGIPTFGLTKNLRQGAERMASAGAGTTLPPELVIELGGLCAPRLHLPLDSFDYGSVGFRGQGRRQRIAKLVEVLKSKLPHARWHGPFELAAAQRDFASELKPLELVAHKRLIMAWLTSQRLWAT